MGIGIEIIKVREMKHVRICQSLKLKSTSLNLPLTILIMIFLIIERTLYCMYLPNHNGFCLYSRTWFIQFSYYKESSALLSDTFKRYVLSARRLYVNLSMNQRERFVNEWKYTSVIKNVLWYTWWISSTVRVRDVIPTSHVLRIERERERERETGAIKIQVIQYAADIGWLDLCLYTYV